MVADRGLNAEGAGGMLLGVVSDTHGHVPLARQAARMLASLEVDVVLHCGDIGSTEIVPLFRDWPTHFVLGNVDLARDRELEAAVEKAGQTFHGRFGALELAGRKVALLHSDDTRRFREERASGRWDLICYGHTHVARMDRENGTLVLNPGAMYRANPHSIAVVKLPEVEATLVEL